MTEDVLQEDRRPNETHFQIALFVTKGVEMTFEYPRSIHTTKVERLSRVVPRNRERPERGKRNESGELSGRKRGIEAVGHSQTATECDVTVVDPVVAGCVSPFTPLFAASAK